MSKKQKLYPHSKEIADKVYYGIKRGMTIQKVYDSVSHRNDCPTSARHFSRIYAQEIKQAKYDLDDEILGHAHKRMEEGSDKLIDLFLRAKVGVNPVDKVQEVDSDNPEESDALSVLMEKLGKKAPDDSDGG